MNLFDYFGLVLMLLAFYAALVSVLQLFGVLKPGTWGVPFVESNLVFAYALLSWGVSVTFQDVLPMSAVVILTINGVVFTILGLLLDRRLRTKRGRVT